MAGCAITDGSDMTRSGLEGFGRSLRRTDEIVVEATGNAMAVVRFLSPYVGRVIVANPMQVKAIAQARIKTDKIDAGVLAQLHASGFLPEVWIPMSGLSGFAASSRGATRSCGVARACEERGAWHPAGAPRAEVPACRSV